MPSPCAFLIGEALPSMGLRFPVREVSAAPAGTLTVTFSLKARATGLAQPRVSESR